MCFMQIGYILGGTLCNICNPLTFRQHQAQSVNKHFEQTFSLNKHVVSNLPQIFKLK